MPVNDKPHLVYASEPPPLRWGYDLPGHDGWVRGLHDMCDFGAAQFHEGTCDLVNFDCIPREVAHIRAYMAKAHPSVPYAIGPAHQTLKRAIEAWRTATEPTP